MHQKLFYPTFPLHYPKQKVKLKKVQQRIISCNCFTSAQQQPLFRKYSKYISDAKCFLHLSLLKRNLSKNSRFIDTDFLVENVTKGICVPFLFERTGFNLKI